MTTFLAELSDSEEWEFPKELKRNLLRTKVLFSNVLRRTFLGRITLRMDRNKWEHI